MVEAIRDIPGNPALGDARAAARPSSLPHGPGAEPGIGAARPKQVAAADAPGRTRGARRTAAPSWPVSPARASFDRPDGLDKRRAARTADLISHHAAASRASAALDWLARLHAAANAALATLARWRDGDAASHERAQRALASLCAQWQGRDRESLGTVDDRLHFDARGAAPRRFTIDGVAPQQWRASMPERLTLFPTGPGGAGVEIDVSNALSAAGLRRHTARALAAYGITLEAPPPEHIWVMRADGARWPSIASKFALAQTGGASPPQATGAEADVTGTSTAALVRAGVPGAARPAILRDAPDAIAPHTWRIDGRDTVAQVRQALASMVRAIRAAHAQASQAARVSAQSVSQSVADRGFAAAQGLDYDAAMACATAWTARLGKLPPFVAMARAMPDGVPMSRANVRALLAG